MKLPGTVLGWVDKGSLDPQGGIFGAFRMPQSGICAAEVLLTPQRLWFACLPLTEV